MSNFLDRVNDILLQARKGEISHDVLEDMIDLIRFRTHLDELECILGHMKKGGKNVSK